MQGRQTNPKVGRRWGRQVTAAVKRLGVPVGLRLGSFRHYPPRELRVASPAAFEGPPGPSISIVTPSFNQAPFLEATLRSVLDQGYEPLEYIVQDGGSTDGSVDVIQRHASDLTHWESAPDAGQSDAINCGFAHSTGEIMAWLNSDDLILPGTLACVAQFFRDHPDVDVVYGHRFIIDEQGRDVGRWVLPSHWRGAILWRCYVPQETMFWRRLIWQAAGGYVDASLQFAMDWDLVLRFHAAGAKFHRIPRFLGAFRTHDQQKSLAWVEETGVAEFEQLRRKYLRGMAKSQAARMGSAIHLLRSIGSTWAYQCGLNSPRT